MQDSLSAPLFIHALMCPDTLTQHSVRELEGIVRYARRAGLLANLAERAQAEGVDVPELADVFEGAQMYAREHSRRIEWEMAQLEPLVRELDCPVLVLKGGAYLAMDLLSSRGRLLSDLDLMVPKQDIRQVESLLLRHAYRSQKQDAYDQHYYREWMHELPPLVHVARGTVVDLHHNIAPPVSRLKLDAANLFQRAVPLVEGSPYLRLSDEDLVLHLCIHMFHDGELHNALRELCDLDAMLRRFGGDEDYWMRLLQRAQALGVLRPLYYGTRFARLLLNTPLPEELVRYLEIAAPLQPLRGLIESAMRRAILPPEGERPGFLDAASEQLLFLRAHWLRMPPLMLLRHLFTQARRRGGFKTAEKVG